MSHFDSNNILAECQHGFRAKRSCETQLIGLTQELHEYLDEKVQVDMIILDFSKAFDKVPHQRLLAKLSNYGIQGNTHRWIDNFLTKRHQRVVVDGETSDWVRVESGVPQGTVLGPVLFLSYINDLPLTVDSKVRLFADDCVIYRPIHSTNDCHALQKDLTELEKWEETWCMSFNATKCSSISITRKKNKISFPYSLHSTTLEEVDSATYLGVELSRDLRWANHIHKTVKKGNKQLALVKRNLQINSTRLKEVAYIGLVRPILEYCSPIWDPYHKKYIDQIEMVQRRAARFVLNRYDRKSSVTKMLTELNWETLEKRRTRARATMLYKVRHQLVAIPQPTIMVPCPTTTRPHRILPPHCETDSYRFSFFPRSIQTWNSLPHNIVEQGSLTSFKRALDNYNM